MAISSTLVRLLGNLFGKIEFLCRPSFRFLSHLCVGLCQSYLWSIRKKDQGWIQEENISPRPSLASVSWSVPGTSQAYSAPYTHRRLKETKCHVGDLWNAIIHCLHISGFGSHVLENNAFSTLFLFNPIWHQRSSSSTSTQTGQREMLMLRSDIEHLPHF